MTRPSRIAPDGNAEEGARRIQWVRRNMPILAAIEAEFVADKPFAGRRMVVCVHLEAKTANLALTLAAGGADVAVCGSNPFSTKDDIAAALAARGLLVYARHGIDRDALYDDMRLALDTEPEIIIDDGGDLVEILHGERPAQLEQVLGVCEETTSGVERARQREASGELGCPLLAVNDARCKTLFDNVHGTGQSVWDAVMRTTNLTIAGSRVVVVGFGWCGRGIAERARGLGARVTVCEVDPVKGADAAMHGFEVAPLADACASARFVITATGRAGVLNTDHFARLADGAVLANAGHFENEIDVNGFRTEATSTDHPRTFVETLSHPRGHIVHLLGGGHIVNIACGDGHPAEIMDVSFGLQALAALHVVRSDSLSRQVIPVPDSIDREIGRRRLKALGLSCDEAPK